MVEENVAKTATTQTDDSGQSQDERKFTQSDVERFIKERFERDGIKELREKAKKYDEVAKSQMTAEEQYKAAIAEMTQKLMLAEAKNAEYEISRLKEELLDKAGLPRSWAKRILGSTEPEIIQDIDALRKQLNDNGSQTVGGGGNPRDKASVVKRPSMAELLNKATR